MSGADLILGAVGVLQFEVVTSRLANEYGVEAVFDNASIWSARWVSCDDKKKLAEFEKANAGNLAIDAGGKPRVSRPQPREFGPHARTLAGHRVPRNARAFGEAERLIKKVQVAFEGLKTRKAACTFIMAN